MSVARSRCRRQCRRRRRREKDALGEPKQRKGPLGESEAKEKMRRAILKNIYPFFILILKSIVLALFAANTILFLKCSIVASAALSSVRVPRAVAPLPRVPAGPRDRATVMTS